MEEDNKNLISFGNIEGDVAISENQSGGVTANHVIINQVTKLLSKELVTQNEEMNELYYTSFRLIFGNPTGGNPQTRFLGNVNDLVQNMFECKLERSALGYDNQPIPWNQYLVTIVSKIKVNPEYFEFRLN
jgi:hypothetical protein